MHVRSTLKAVSIVAGLLLMALVALTAEPRRVDLGKTVVEMTDAAHAFWASLTPDQQKVAGFKFDDAERLNWHFIPRARKGLPIKDMKEDQRKLALALLGTGLSTRGDDQATTNLTRER